jgi:hypothetical protein
MTRAEAVRALEDRAGMCERTANAHIDNRTDSFAAYRARIRATVYRAYVDEVEGAMPVLASDPHRTVANILVSMRRNVSAKVGSRWGASDSQWQFPDTYGMADDLVRGALASEGVEDG